MKKIISLLLVSTVLLTSVVSILQTPSKAAALPTHTKALSGSEMSCTGGAQSCSDVREAVYKDCLDTAGRVFSEAVSKVLCELVADGKFLVCLIGKVIGFIAGLFGKG